MLRIISEIRTTSSDRKEDSFDFNKNNFKAKPIDWDCYRVLERSLCTRTCPLTSKDPHFPFSVRF